MINQNPVLKIFRQLIKWFLLIAVGIFTYYCFSNAFYYAQVHLTWSPVTAFVALLMIVLTVATAILLKTNRLPQLSNQKLWLVIVIITLVALVWQFLLVSRIGTNIAGWDPWAIYSWLMDPAALKTPYYQDYFSYNQNNLGILYIYYYIKKFAGLFGQYFSWKALDFVNALAIITGGVFLSRVLKRFVTNNATVFGFVLYTLFLSVSPWSLIPYTDTFLLPLLTGAILLGFKALENSSHRRVFFFESFGAGVLAVFCYFVKASGFIFVIAALVICLLHCQKAHQHRRFIGLVSLGLVTGYLVFNLFTQQQKIAKLNPQLNTPFTLFMVYGVKNRGMWNGIDAQEARAIKNPHQRFQYNLNKWQKLLQKELKSGRYWQYLNEKIYYTTRDGTLGWGQEGGSPYSFMFAHWDYHTHLEWWLKSIYYPTGRHKKLYQNTSQILWLILWGMIFLGLIRLTFHPLSIRQEWLLITILGGTVFLIIFEAGRTRYMIQFLPFYIILATLFVNPTHNRKTTLSKQKCELKRELASTSEGPQGSRRLPSVAPARRS